MSDQKIISTIHENIIKRLKGPKAPIGQSNPAIHSRVQGRKNLIRGVVELSRRPSPKARESLRSLARAYDSVRRMGKPTVDDIIRGMEKSSLGGESRR